MTVAIIGGSGLDGWPDAGVVQTYSAQSEWGEASAAPQLLQFERGHCLFLPRHGADHRFAPHSINYRANLQVLQDAGATSVIAVNAVGGISARCTTTDLVLPDDVIDYTWGRAHTYFEYGQIEHVEFGEPYDPVLRARLAATASAAGIDVITGGVYGATQGPRLETVAEIRRMAQDGCDIVGMTGMPEAALARELGLPYAALCLVVNPAAGVGDEAITMAAIEAVIENGISTVRRLLTAFVAA